MLINIKCSNGSTVPVEADLSCKVADFKALIAEKVEVPAAQQVPAPCRLFSRTRHPPTRVRAPAQRLIYSGKVLKDPETLASYSVVDGHTIHMVRGAAPADREKCAAARQHGAAIC